ncbi:MAG TPA: phosphotransferase [Anaerolineae bacterium]|nr:phosphotransferase [Anaerolineae bacterium]
MVTRETKIDIEIARSFISAETVRAIVADSYDLGEVVSCKLFSKLLRTQDNDHYLLTMKDGTEYVFRLYQAGEGIGRQESDYLFEIDWLTHLHKQGVLVSYAIAHKDGGHLGYMDAPEGRRYYALFTMIDGQAMDAKDPDQLFALGQAMAQIHLASKGFTSKHKRYKTDLNYLIDEPIARIRSFWGEHRVAELETLEVSAVALRKKVETLLGKAGTDEGVWGVIGGDFHGANTRFNEDDELGFFNFDLCGYGWWAYDIAVFLSNTPAVQTKSALSEAFFAGYYSVRPLRPEEHEAVASFISIRRIWLMGSFALGDGLAGHTFVASA